MSQPSAPTFSNRFGGIDRVYVRKLAKRSDWNAENPQSVHLFGDEDLISLYQVSSDIELMQVVVGMNSRRPSLLMDIDLLPLLPEELSEFGLSPIASPGNLECECANKLHVDIANTQLEIEQLMSCLTEKQRQVVRITKGDMKKIVIQMEGCMVLNGQTNCILL